MKNYICKGERIQATAPSGGVASGDLVLIGSKVAVVLASALEGETFIAITEGAFEVPKEVGAITIGAPLYYKADTKTVTTTAAGHLLAGFAYEAAASGDTTAKVVLCCCVLNTPAALVANVGGATAADAITTVNALLASLKASGLMANS